MEGGGVIVYLDERGEIMEEPLVEISDLDNLRSFTTKLKHHYPHVPLSRDSFGRLTDRAIEFHLMEQSWIEQVMNFMNVEKIHFSKSNVHINFWCGNISKYLVDDKKSSFTEVGTLLRSYGVDLDNNRFLILQGEVEQISMMKPKALTPHEEGLLGYLEDIIGSNQFIEKIDEVSCFFSLLFSLF
jgi:hypothetical protein